MSRFYANIFPGRNEDLAMSRSIFEAEVARTANRSVRLAVIKDHIHRLESELDVLARRNVHFIRRYEYELWIANFPPPLMADNDDVVAANLGGKIGGMHNVEG